jgi:hypothetical protein
MPWWIWPCAWLCCGILGNWIALTAWRNKWGDLEGIGPVPIIATLLSGPAGLVAAIACALTFLSEDIEP